jgi:hypothetical protein
VTDDLDAEDLACLADLNGEDLACLGMSRVSRFDFFTEAERAEWRAEWVRALGALKPRPNPAPPKPRRPRKPSLARLIAKAKELGVDVTIGPDGAVTFRTGSAATVESDPETELKKWIASHAH